MKKKTLTGAATVLMVALMVGAAELLGEKEIIFPEITALAVGALVAPKQAWAGCWSCGFCPRLCG